MKNRLLYIEDEIDLGNVTKQYLELMGFEVAWCTKGMEALDLYRKAPNSFNLIIIDIQLPDIEGFRLAEQMLPLNPDVYFIFLTARKEKIDRIRGLKIGAMDYITKPFDVDELVLRIQNITRHQRFDSLDAKRAVIQEILVIGDISLDINLLLLGLPGNKSISVTQREAELLKYLFENRNSIIRRTDILLKVWGENDYFLGRSLDVFISRLRKILQTSICVRIDNVYGIGFIFSVKPKG